MARNSAPITRNRPAAQTKERMRKRTECTGFLAMMTAKAETARTIAKIQKNQASACIVRLLSQSPCAGRPHPARARAKRHPARSAAFTLRPPLGHVLQQQAALADQARLTTRPVNFLSG